MSVSDDLAHEGVSATGALTTIFGGEEPEEKESWDDMRARLLTMQRPEGEHGYDDMASYLAHVILVMLEAHPELQEVPTEAVYGGEYHPETNTFDSYQPGLWQFLKPLLDEADREFLVGFTGFQWGWAVNAARRCLFLPAVPNPAIITIST